MTTFTTIPENLLRRYTLRMLILLLGLGPIAANSALQVRDESRDLQAVLDRGEDLWLEPRSTHEITTTLYFRRPGQQIGTRNAKEPADFAVVRVAAGSLMTAIDATGVAGASLERIVLDGNRRMLVPTGGKVPDLPFTAWGKAGGDRQSVRECFVFDARCGGGWGAIHVNEGASDILIENNVVFGAGTDCRGNGRAETERAFGWGDGISTASRNTIVRNNLILDATDDGIMVQGAAGTTVEANVVSAISREMLGGIVLIDPFADYQLPGAPSLFDYRGIVVRRNRIESLGAQIQIGIPMGGVCWNERMAGKTLVGATVVENSLGGEAFGYGFIADGVDDFIILGNVSNATHSGQGDGPRRNAPDPAGAFLYNPTGVGSSSLQPEFKKVAGHIHSLLRNRPPPADSFGYRIANYTEPELSGIIRMAFLEITKRDPNAEEIKHWAAWIRNSQTNADALRLELAAQLSEGDHPKLDGLSALQSWRLERWRMALFLAWHKAPSRPGANWPTATNFLSEALQSLKARY